jgi:site-specific recombinase XerC
MASLMYGAGLRLQECVELRIKDVNFDDGWRDSEPPQLTRRRC